MEGRLSGKNVIIAGAGQTPGEDIGNGRAMAIRFAQEGANLYLTALHAERAEETARMIRQENPQAKVFPASLDATDEKAVREMYNMTKAGMIHMGEIFASMYAKDGIRVNTIVLGLVQTPMALVFNQEKTGKSREEVIRERNARVPLKGGQGTAWDTANAALFLASDEARFITGASLPVDGGLILRRG